MNYVLTNEDFGANGWRTQESIDRESRFYRIEEVKQFLKDMVFYILVSTIPVTFHYLLSELRNLP